MVSAYETLRRSLIDAALCKRATADLRTCLQAQTKHENWVGVLQEVQLPGTDGSAPSFLSAAVDFCNKDCWGCLSASIIVHPSVQKAHQQELEAAIADLEYGSVAVNAPSFVCYAIPQLAWGAYPGHQPHVSSTSLAKLPPLLLAVDLDAGQSNFDSTGLPTAA